MTNDIILYNSTSTTLDMLVPSDAQGNLKSRLILFSVWMDSTNQKWYAPNLKLYRDNLADRKLKASSINAHLSTIRARYSELLLDRDLFYNLTNQELGILERKALVDEIVERLRNAIDPRSARVKTKTTQDESDLTHTRLSEDQADSLLQAPFQIYKKNKDSLPALRDTALIAMMLCTGVREAELVDVKVDDLRHKLTGELSLKVREGKGMKQRLIPYGELSWVLSLVNAWLQKANIQEGHIFRRILKGGKTVGKQALTTRAVQKILTLYPVYGEDGEIVVRPHDLRRTYARRLYDSGVDPVRIQQNLGHANLKTTLGYIGDIHAGKRRPPAIYKAPIDLIRQLGNFSQPYPA